MSTLIFLLEKEFRQIFRNTSILRMIIVIPIVQLLILPMAADYEIKNINISVVDHDQSSRGRRLVETIVASGYFRLQDYGTSFQEAYAQFERDQSDLILEIPHGFERDLVRENHADLFIAVNAINGTKASVGNAYLSRIIRSYNDDIRLEWKLPPRYHPAPTIDINTLNWFNPTLSYPVFMVPGILVVLVTMIGTYTCAINVVKEKELGTIEQINVTPIKKHIFILGKLIPFWLIGVFVFSLGLFGIARLVYSIIPVGDLWTVYVFLSIYLIALLGISLLISTYSNTQQQAMSLAFFFVMIFLLMSGLFTPVESMPDWARWISRLNPVTYFIDVMRLVVLKGSSFREILPHFLAMVCFAIFFNGWAILNYRKTSN